MKNYKSKNNKRRTILYLHHQKKRKSLPLHFLPLTLHQQCESETSNCGRPGCIEFSNQCRNGRCRISGILSARSGSTLSIYLISRREGPPFLVNDLSLYVFPLRRDPSSEAAWYPIRPGKFPRLLSRSSEERSACRRTGGGSGSGGGSTRLGMAMDRRRSRARILIPLLLFSLSLSPHGIAIKPPRYRPFPDSISIADHISTLLERRWPSGRFSIRHSLLLTYYNLHIKIQNFHYLLLPKIPQRLNDVAKPSRCQGMNDVTFCT